MVASTQIDNVVKRHGKEFLEETLARGELRFVVSPWEWIEWRVVWRFRTLPLLAPRRDASVRAVPSLLENQNLVFSTVLSCPTVILEVAEDAAPPLFAFGSRHSISIDFGQFYHFAYAGCEIDGKRLVLSARHTLFVSVESLKLVRHVTTHVM